MKVKCQGHFLAIFCLWFYLFLTFAWNHRSPGAIWILTQLLRAMVVVGRPAWRPDIILFQRKKSFDTIIRSGNKAVLEVDDPEKWTICSKVDDPEKSLIWSLWHSHTWDWGTYIWAHFVRIYFHWSNPLPFESGFVGIDSVCQYQNKEL